MTQPTSAATAVAVSQSLSPPERELPITAFKVHEKYETGLWLMHSGHVLAAMQQFQEASFFDPHDALPIVALAECYVFLCDLRSAIRCYRRALWSLHKRDMNPDAAEHQHLQMYFAIPSPVSREGHHEGGRGGGGGGSGGAPHEVPLPSRHPPERPTTAQFTTTTSPAFLSAEVLHAMEMGSTVELTPSEEMPLPELQERASASPMRTKTSSSISLSSAFSSPNSPNFTQVNRGGVMSSGGGEAASPRRRFGPTAVMVPQKLSMKDVRKRLAGVLDALGMALYQTGSVEQALRCTTEALELLSTETSDEGSSGGAPRETPGSEKDKTTQQQRRPQSAVRHPAALRELLTKPSDPHLSDPTIALHRAVFLMALQLEEEAETLLERHHARYPDWRTQTTALLIQLYCNRQAFRKARQLLESQEEHWQQGSSTGTNQNSKTTAALSAGAGHKAASPLPLASTEAIATVPAPALIAKSDASSSSSPSAAGPAAAPPSLAVAKYIFTELYARYRTAALASNDENSITRCLDIYPNDVDLLFARAQLRVAARRHQESVKDLFRCVRETNGEHKAAIEAMTSVLFAIGSSLDGEAEVHEAVTYYSESLKWRPDNVLVLLARGDCYTKMGSYEEALTDFEAILECEPGHREAQQRIAVLHDLWGRKLFALDRAAEAEAEFTNAIKADSTNPEFFYHRALCRLKLDQGRYALRDVLSCKELHPTAPHLRAFIARYIEPVVVPAAPAATDLVTQGDVMSSDDNHRTKTGVGAMRRMSATGARPLLPTSASATAGASRGASSPPPPPESVVVRRHPAVSSRSGSDKRRQRLDSDSAASSAALPPIRKHRAPHDAAAEGWIKGSSSTLHQRRAAESYTS